MCYISVCKKNKSQNLIKSNFKSSWWLFLFYHYFSTKLKGFSANFGFPLWKELLISIIEKIENEFQDLDDYYKKELKNLKSMVQNNFDLSRVLDNLKSLLEPV